MWEYCQVTSWAHSCSSSLIKPWFQSLHLNLCWFCFITQFLFSAPRSWTQTEFDLPSIPSDFLMLPWALPSVFQSHTYIWTGPASETDVSQLLKTQDFQKGSMPTFETISLLIAFVWWWWSTSLRTYLGKLKTLKARASPTSWPSNIDLDYCLTLTMFYASGLSRIC